MTVNTVTDLVAELAALQRDAAETQRIRDLHPESERLRRLCDRGLARMERRRDELMARMGEELRNAQTV